MTEPDPLSLTEIFRRFRQNIAIVIGSRLVFGLVNLATNVLIIRAFGVMELGIAVLLQGYVRLFADIVKLESWQMILRFGAVEQDVATKTNDSAALRRLYGFGLLLDLVAMSLAIIGAILFVPLAADIFGWPPAVEAFAPYFALSMLFITHGTANGILRLYDRVDALAWQFSINATLRFLGVGLAAVLGGDILHIVLAWFVASVISGIYPLIVAFSELRKRHMMPRFSGVWQQIGQTFPGMWRFLWFTNLRGQLSIVINHGTTLFIGAELDAAAAGTYEVARRFTSALSRPTQLLGPLIFPEIAKLAAQSDWAVIRQLMLRQLRMTALLILGVGAVLLSITPWLISALFGPELSGDIFLFRLLIVGVLISVLGFTLEPVMLSANRPGTVLALNFVAVLVYLAVSLALLHSYGLLAFAIGLICYYVVHQTLFTTNSLRLMTTRQGQVV